VKAGRGLGPEVKAGHGSSERLTGSAVGGTLALLFLLAMCLRPAMASVPPVLVPISRDLHMSRAVGGLLTTIPVICLAAFAPFGARLGQRVGVERLVVATLLLLGLAMAARAGGRTPAIMFATTLCAGLAIGVNQTLLGPLVKRYFATAAALATGVYSAGINIGASAAAAATVPLQSALSGSWPMALAVWGVLPVAVAALWARRGQGGSSVQPSEPAPAPRFPLRFRRAWTVTIFFGLQSLVYYALLTWTAPMYEALGWPKARSGLLLSLFTLTEVAGALTVSLLANRSADRRPWMLIGSALLALGLLGLALAPLSAPWLWIAMAGYGGGGLFPLGLALPIDNTRTEAEAGSWMAMTLCLGYLIAAAGPYGIGRIVDATGGFRTALLALCGLAALEVGTSLALTPRLALAAKAPAGA